MFKIGLYSTGNTIKKGEYIYLECKCDTCGIVKNKRKDRYIENEKCNALRHHHKDIASMLSENDDDTKYTRMSGKVAEWKCKNCNTTFKQRVSDVVSRGLSCPMCSKGRSFPNRFMYSLLSQLGVSFEYEKNFDWIKNKRYDFYIPDINTIIEMNGEYHYKDTSYNDSGKVSENDRYKKETAIRNGIHDYIIIDSIESDSRLIIENVINSRMSDYFKLSNIDFDMVELNAYKEDLKDILDEYGEVLSATEISKMIGLQPDYVANVLKCATKCEMCDYSVENLRLKAQSIASEARKKKIMCLTTGEIFESINEASLKFGISPKALSNCINGRTSSSGVDSEKRKLKWKLMEE